MILDQPVNKALFRMSAPISLGMLSTFLFNVVDSYFVGKLGSQALGALGFSATIYFIITSLFMGFSVGTSSLVAKSLGEKKPDDAKSITTISLMITLFVSGSLAGLGILFSDTIFTVLGADPQLLPQIKEYIIPLLIGVPALALSLVGGAAVRSTGRVKEPEILFMISGVLNLIFDYLLIFGYGPFPELGLKGAALATVIAWIFLASGILVLTLNEKLVTFKPVDFAKNFKGYLSMSTPAIAAQVLTPISILFFTYLIAKSGTEAVAAYGIASRIEMLALVAISSVTVAIVPFIGQNFGAKKMDRVDDAIALSGKVSTYWGSMLFIVFAVFSVPILSIFSDDTKVLDFGSQYFLIVAISYPAHGIILVTASILNALQFAGDALKILAQKTFLLTIPMVLIGSIWGTMGIFIGMSLSNFAGAILAGRVMISILKEEDSDIPNRSAIKDHIQDFKWLINKVRRKRVI